MDEFFKEEDLKDYSDDDPCCSEQVIKKTLCLEHSPDDLILHICRFEYANNRMIKIRTPVQIDPVINVKKYSQSEQDILYRLHGIVIHHGNSPRTGHYTYINTAGPSPVLIDDTKIRKHDGSNERTDCYLLRYEKISIDTKYDEFLAVLACHIFSQGLRIGMERYLPSSMMSIRKQRISELVESTEMVKIEDVKLHRLSKLLQDGIDSKEMAMSTPKDMIDNIINYLFGENNDMTRRTIGISFLQLLKCLDCNFRDVVQRFEITYQPLSRSTAEKMQCPRCFGYTVVVQDIVTKLGHSVVLQNSASLIEKDISEWLTSLAFLHPPKNIRATWSAYYSTEDVALIKYEDTNVGDSHCIAKVTAMGETETISKRQYHEIVETETSQQRNLNNFLFVDIVNLEDQIRYKVDEDYNLKLDGWDKLKIDLNVVDRRLCDIFDISINIGNDTMPSEEVIKFMTGEFASTNIDLFGKILLCDDDTFLFISADWLRPDSALDHSLQHGLLPRKCWLDKNLIFIPVNDGNRHWMLIVFHPASLTLFYLDPLNGTMNRQILENVVSFIHFKHLMERGFELQSQVTVTNLMKTGYFPKQNDGSSCGAYVCLYIMMLFRNLYHDATAVRGSCVRQLVFSKVLSAVYKERSHDIVELKVIIGASYLDQIVHDICVGIRSERHDKFFKNPMKEKKYESAGFGKLYISEHDYFCLQLHLIKRYFRSKRSSTKIQPSTSVFDDASQLNAFVRQNLHYVSWYVECVLAKEVLVEVVSREMHVDIPSVNHICMSTETSLYEQVKTEVKLARQTKYKQK